MSKRTRKKFRLPNGTSKPTGAKDGSHYTVEKILDKRVRNGKTEYLLKWENYPASESTWEPEENFDSVEMIRQFEKKLQYKNTIQQRRDLNPFKAFKALYNAEDFGTLLQSIVPPSDYSDITHIDSVDSYPDLVIERIVGVSWNLSTLCFVVQFSNVNNHVLVDPDVLYRRWPTDAWRFYQEWIEKHYTNTTVNGS